MKAPEILDRAAQHMRDRAASRDQPDGERSMLRTVNAFNALTGATLSERDGWLFMVVLKAARACSTPTGLADDYEDGAAYFGLAGESAPSCEVVVNAEASMKAGVDIGRRGGDGTVINVAIGGLFLAVPKRFSFVAQDADGAVWAYAIKPITVDNGWATPLVDAKYLGRARTAAPDWRHSLMDLQPPAKPVVTRDWPAIGSRWRSRGGTPAVVKARGPYRFAYETNAVAAVEFTFDDQPDSEWLKLSDWHDMMTPA